MTSSVAVFLSFGIMFHWSHLSTSPMWTFWKTIKALWSWKACCGSNPSSKQTLLLELFSVAKKWRKLGLGGWLLLLILSILLSYLLKTAQRFSGTKWHINCRNKYLDALHLQLIKFTLYAYCGIIVTFLNLPSALGFLINYHVKLGKTFYTHLINISNK